MPAVDADGVRARHLSRCAQGCQDAVLTWNNIETMRCWQNGQVVSNTPSLVGAGAWFSCSAGAQYHVMIDMRNGRVAAAFLFSIEWMLSSARIDPHVYSATAGTVVTA